MRSTYEDVAAVLITRNEEKAIAKVVNDLKSAIPGANIYVIDDSTDQTKEIALSCGAIVSSGPGKGFGPAFHQALMTPEEPIIVTVDADDTYPVEILPHLIASIRSGFDVAGADRLGGGKPESMPLTNYVSNQVFSLVASLRASKRVRDVHSGQRAYKRSLIHEIQWEFDFDAFPIDLIFVPAMLGYQVCEFSIEYRERIGTSTLNKWSSGKASLRRLCRSSKAINSYTKK